MSTSKKNRRAFLQDGLAVVAVASLGGQLLVGCSSSTPGAPGDARRDEGGRDAGDARPADAARPDVRDAKPRPDAAPTPRPTTTVRQRIQGVLPTVKQPSSTKKQWGVTQLAPGEAHERTDLLAVAATAGTSSGPAASLLYLAQLTDIHVIDEESPARTINLDNLLTAAWRAQEAHTAQVLDAAVRQVRAFDACRPLDLVLFTGDCIDNNQQNELGWFLKVLEGGTLRPNSGDLEDPLPGPDNDPHDAMAALGLGAIPWYAVMGNHDGLIQGNLPHGTFLDHSLVTGDPTRGSIADLDLGRVNPPACSPIPADESPTPPRCVPTSPSGLKSGGLPADKARVHLTKSQWLSAVTTAGGKPVGHGLTGALATTGDGDTVVEPVPGLPLRLVVLNTCAPLGAEGIYPGNKIDGFLDQALKQAQLDDVLVIVSSHHGSDGVAFNAGKLRDKLNAYPSVVLHIVGHGHQNLITPRPGATPQHGYWEVQTCALAEWPQQGRLVELVDNRDGTAELWLTLFDFDTTHQPLGPLAAASRFLALREIHAGTGGGGTKSEGKKTDRNVILPVALTAALRQKLAALPGKPIEAKLFA